MTAVKRYFYVGPQSSLTTHRTYANSFTEGIRTLCGITVRKGWWYRFGSRNKFDEPCKRCH